MVNEGFWLVEDEPVAERRVVVTPDESPTGGTTDENSLGVCRRCGRGEAYIRKFADGTTDVFCDCCLGLGFRDGRPVRKVYRRG